MTVYRVKDWGQTFENNKSRERDQCSFVCVPNKQSGLGFSRTMAEPDGATIYGIFQLIIGACSRQKKPREGWLTENGLQAGTPWAPSDLAIMFRRPQAEIERALTFLCSPKVGWLISAEVPDTETPAISGHKVPADCPPTALEGKKEGMEVKEGSEAKPAHEDCSIPTVDEIATYCDVGLGIPRSYCEHYHVQKTINNGWIKNGLLVRWKLEIPRWWAKDQATWGQRATAPSGNGNGGSIWSKQKQLDAINAEMKKIEFRGHDDPVAGIVIKPEDRQAYRDFKKKRSELTAQIAKG